VVFLREEGTAKTFGILAAETGGYKRQCDCFVTKRLTDEPFALKEVTNQLHRSERLKQCLWGQSGISIAQVRSIWKNRLTTKALRH